MEIEVEFDRKDLTECHTRIKVPPESRYPEGAALCADYLAQGEHRKIIGHDTKIATIGSCFAREVMGWMEANGFNVLRYGSGEPARHGSAGWGPVYNTGCIRQEVERGFGAFHPREMYWKVSGSYRSPYRPCVSWSDVDEMAKERASHAADCHRVWSEADVVVMTVGVNEVWHTSRDGATFAQWPRGAYDPGHHKFKFVDVDENVSNLQAARDLLPEATHIIVTVSPVPLLLTFRPGMNALEATAESKAALLLAAREFARNNPDNVTYFPSYEIVTTASRGAGYKDDNRHVSTHTVDSVMRVFRERHVK